MTGGIVRMPLSATVNKSLFLYFLLSLGPYHIRISPNDTVKP